MDNKIAQISKMRRNQKHQQWCIRATFKTCKNIYRANRSV